MALNLKLEDIEDVEDFEVKSTTNKCIMIVNSFKDHAVPDMYLKGYEADAKRLEETLDRFNFETTVYEDVKGKQFVSKINHFIKGGDFDDDDCIACAIFTHGLEHGELCGPDYDENTNKTTSIETIINCFTEMKQFRGKPKIFFIQACRGKLHAVREGVKKIKHAGVEQVVEQSDVIVFYSTFEGYVAFVDDDHGSFFIQALCKVLQKFGGKHSLQKIATKLNHILCGFEAPDGSCQASEVRYSLRYDVYLNSDGKYPKYSSVKASIQPPAAAPVDEGDSTEDVITKESIHPDESEPTARNQSTPSAPQNESEPTPHNQSTPSAPQVGGMMNLFGFIPIPNSVLEAAVQLADNIPKSVEQSQHPGSSNT